MRVLHRSERFTTPRRWRGLLSGVHEIASGNRRKINCPHRGNHAAPGASLRGRLFSDHREMPLTNRPMPPNYNFVHFAFKVGHSLVACGDSGPFGFKRYCVRTTCFYALFHQSKKRSIRKAHFGMQDATRVYSTGRPGRTRILCPRPTNLQALWILGNERLHTRTAHSGPIPFFHGGPKGPIDFPAKPIGLFLCPYFYSGTNRPNRVANTVDPLPTHYFFPRFVASLFEL